MVIDSVDLDLLAVLSIKEDNTTVCLVLSSGFCRTIFCKPVHADLAVQGSQSHDVNGQNSFPVLHEVDCLGSR